jgi:MobA/MobL family/Large polyvalent protein-associated domain 7
MATGRNPVSDDARKELFFRPEVDRVQPKKGQKLHKISAYNRACELTGPEGEQYDFRRKRKNNEYLGGFMIAPPDAPEKLIADPAAMWAAALKMEHRYDGNPAITFVIAIPDMIREEDRADFVRGVMTPRIKNGAIAQVDLHNPWRTEKNPDGTRSRQPHAHVIMSRFACGPQGFYGKKLGDEEYQKSTLQATRAAMANDMNAWLNANGYAAFVDPRSKKDRGIDTPTERTVSRRAVEAWKACPDTADEFPAILSERKQRRRMRAEKAALAEEIAAADNEIRTLEMELTNVRSQTPAAEPTVIRPDSLVDSSRSESDARRHTADSDLAPTPRAGRRRGQDRPAFDVVGRRADKPRPTPRKSRPAQRQAEGVTLGRTPQRPGDDDLRQARERLRQADGRANKARRRARERAEFQGARADAEERLQQARARLYESDGRGAKARKHARERAEFRGARPDADERLRQARRKARDAGAPGVGPSAPADRLARRRRFLAALLRSTYDTGWLDEAAAANIKDIKLDRAAAVVTIYLHGGGRITDNGEFITLAGKPTATAVAELLTAADRHGWTSGGIEVSGDADFRRAVAIELLSRRPPVAVTGLDTDDKQAVAEQLQQRQRDWRRAALDAMTNAERVATDAYLQRPNGRRENEVLKAVRDAQAAISHNDDAAIDAAMSGDIPGAMRAGMSWRLKMTPQAPAVDVTIEPEPPGLALLPAYVPPWIRDPRWQAKRDSDGTN